VDDPYYIDIEPPIYTSFNSDGWGTACLPYDVVVPEEMLASVLLKVPPFLPTAPISPTSPRTLPNSYFTIQILWPR